MRMYTGTSLFASTYIVCCATSEGTLCVYEHKPQKDCFKQLKHICVQESASHGWH